VYLAVSSANLTLSGWGRNAESFGETWIHTQGQGELCEPLHDLLNWLDANCGISEKQGGVAAIRKTLDSLPNRRRFNIDPENPKPWSSSLYARLYVSVLPVSKEKNTYGFANFLRKGKRKPHELWGYSPYWGDVASNIEGFGAESTVLVPAMRSDGLALSLSSDQFGDLNQETTWVYRNEEEAGDRFWHMKAYSINYGKSHSMAVGSCNFTGAGLKGGVEGNVEAMIVFDNKDDSWLPKSVGDVAYDDFCVEVEVEEGVPEPVPVAIVVVWDWMEQSWRWWLNPSQGQSKFELHLPGMGPFAIKAPGGKKRGPQPSRGAKYTVSYSVGDMRKSWEGQVVELNLVHSQRTYGRPLSALDILESWRTGSPPGDGNSSSRNKSEGDEDDEIKSDPPAAFDVVNLYDLFRSTRALRERLEKQSNPAIQRSILVGRADSAMSLAYLADREHEVPVVRYLILREIYDIVSKWSCLFEQDEIAVVRRAEEIANRARKKVLQDLKKELQPHLRHKSSQMLKWFELRLKKLDRTVVHESV
jgi:hypothetical protein